MSQSTYDHLLSTRDQKGGAFLVLIDPDRLDIGHVGRFLQLCHVAEVDALLIGSSILHNANIEEYLRLVRAETTLPVIGFPGAVSQLSRYLDAVLFLSVVSGRNPEYLFGQHVHAAPIIRALGIEPISTGYMLVESGATTTAQYMSHSLPLPRNKPDVAAATGLAAEMLGMKMLFLDGGSGANGTIPDEMVHAVARECTAPVMVGGGIRRPEEVARKVQAGAGFVVVGTALEERPDGTYMAELASAAHVAVPRLT